MDFFFFEKYNDFPVFLQSCEQKIILRVLSNPLFLKIIFDFIWYIVGITNLYSLSTFVYASLVFSRLITENPVQRKSIWQPIPDFVIIWFLGKKKPQHDQTIPTEIKWQNTFQMLWICIIQYNKKDALFCTLVSILYVSIHEYMYMHDK